MHNHKHIVGNVFVNRPPLTAAIAEKWLRELVAKVGMNILLDSRAVYCEDLGNEGVTGLIALSTSHASFHCWHQVERPFFNFDLYSCRDYDPNVVITHLDEYFGVSGGEYIIIDRNDGLKVTKKVKLADTRPLLDKVVEFVRSLMSRMKSK